MEQNPHVDRFLSDPMIDDVDHALGRPLWPLRETDRNYFCFPANSDGVAKFAASPYWKPAGHRGEMVFYAVTDAGKQALVEYLAAHDPHAGYEVTWNGTSDIVAAVSSSQAKYRVYLNARDAFSDLKFVDFARDARVKKAA